MRITRFFLFPILEHLYSCTMSCDNRPVLTPFLPLPTPRPGCAAAPAASVRQVNAAICNSGNRAFRGYCSGSETDSVNLYNLVTSPLIPSLLLSLWQTVVMPHALYFLSLVRARCPAHRHYIPNALRRTQHWSALQTSNKF